MATGRIATLQRRTQAKRLTEAEPDVIQGPGQDLESALSLTIGRNPGSNESGHAGSGSDVGAQSSTMAQVRSVPHLTTISQDTTMYASMFEPLSRSLETFITKLSKSTERGERSRRALKKPKSYKDESDGCIDTWIEAMKLHFEEENLSKKQEGSALTSNLEGTALSCVWQKGLMNETALAK